MAKFGNSLEAIAEDRQLVGEVEKFVCALQGKPAETHNGCLHQEMLRGTMSHGKIPNALFGGKHVHQGQNLLIWMAMGG